MGTKKPVALIAAMGAVGLLARTAPSTASRVAGSRRSTALTFQSSAYYAGAIVVLRQERVKTGDVARVIEMRLQRGDRSAVPRPMLGDDPRSGTVDVRRF